MVVGLWSVFPTADHVSRAGITATGMRKLVVDQARPGGVLDQLPRRYGHLPLATCHPFGTRLPQAWAGSCCEAGRRLEQIVHTCQTVAE